MENEPVNATVQAPRLVIAAVSSNTGKTSVTCGLLKALLNKSLKPASFKCGPDYVDPVFHSKVMGISSDNLDLYMCKSETVKHIFARRAATFDISIIEGVMGIYDGLGPQGHYSTNDLSLELDAPTILVVNPAGMSNSLAALIYGYLNYKTNNIKGVILNRVSERMYTLYRDLIEEELKIKVYGYIPNIAEACFPSKRLGLDISTEDMLEKVELLGAACEKTLDIDGLIKLAGSAPVLTFSKNLPFLQQTSTTEDAEQSEPVGGQVHIAVALDDAFMFYYRANIELLESYGAKITYFSPLYDKSIASDVDAVIIGGGYPWDYISVLSSNQDMLKSLKNAYNEGVVFLAESGGYAYLCNTLHFEGKSYKGVGIIDTDVHRTEKLVRFGYSELTALKDNILCMKNNKLRCHEFHYSDTDDNGDAFSAVKQSGDSWSCVHSGDNLFAGYPHIHFWQESSPAFNFIQICLEAGKKRGNKK